MRIYNNEYGEGSSAIEVQCNEVIISLLIRLAQDNNVFKHSAEPIVNPDTSDVAVLYYDGTLRTTFVPEGTFSLLDALADNSPREIIIPSSSLSIYSTPVTAISEDDSDDSSSINDTLEEAITEVEDSEEEESNIEESQTNSGLIPRGTISLSSNDSTSRFSGASWYGDAKRIKVTIAGVGGIGSWTALLVSRLGVNRIDLYDPDTVEAVNLAGQLYGASDIGRSKVRAISGLINSISNMYSTYGINGLLKNDSIVQKILICGFDNMNSRKTAFEVWKGSISASNPQEYLFIDGRLNAEEFQIFCIRGDDDYNINRYSKEFLFDDNEVQDAPCSYKQTSYCASMIASFITNLFVNHVHNLKESYMRRDLPFFTSYNAETMFLKTED